MTSPAVPVPPHLTMHIAQTSEIHSKPNFQTSLHRTSEFSIHLYATIESISRDHVNTSNARPTTQSSLSNPPYPTTSHRLIDTQQSVRASKLPSQLSNSKGLQLNVICAQAQQLTHSDRVQTCAQAQKLTHRSDGIQAMKKTVKCTPSINWIARFPTCKNVSSLQKSQPRGLFLIPHNAGGLRHR